MNSIAKIDRKIAALDAAIEKHNAKRLSAYDKLMKAKALKRERDKLESLKAMFKKISDCIESMSIDDRRRFRQMIDSGELLDLVNTIDREENEPDCDEDDEEFKEVI